MQISEIKNITSDQRRLLGELEILDPELVGRWDEARGVAARVRGKLAIPSREDEEPEETFQEFLAKYGDLFGSSNLTQRIKLLRSRTDELNWTHLEYQQLYLLGKQQQNQEEKPLEIYASKLVGHIMPDGALTEVQSSCWRDIQLHVEVRIKSEDLREIILKTVITAPGFQELQQQMKELKEEDFPIMQTPRLVVYPWQGGFRLAWTTYAYGVIDVEDRSGKPTGAKKLDLGQVFIDANTGEQFIFASMSRDAETPDTGTGLGVTPLSGPFVTRNLNIVRVDTSSTYRMRDTTHGREIITYDAENSASYDTDPERGVGLNNGTLPISEDTDGNKNWNKTPTNNTVTERTASQQPEVDLHHFMREAYELYEALAGGTRDGWDNNQYTDPPVPNQIIRGIAHARDGTNPSSNNAGECLGLVDKKFICWLQFFNGDSTNFSYFAGSPFLVFHEYQHAMTDFNFVEGGDPGLIYSGWFAAVHEGLSDVFGGLLSKQWETSTEISLTNTVGRNLAFPRDPNSYCNSTLLNHNKDHFDDRDLDFGFRYDRGTILAHCAYLMGQGGVHQRSVRTPELIPVYSLGQETVSGKNVLKAARIWYLAVTHYFSTHGTLTQIPDNDENTFRTLRDACESAAIQIYQQNSSEHLNTVLAFYAVGLEPEIYGADVTFLRWGHSWRISRPYIGLSCPDWASLDLFVNNGGTSEWNAVVNVLDTSGSPTQFENTIYCRVRNVGDLEAQNVKVQLQYAKAGTGVTTWLDVTDKDGNIQELNIGNLAAGESNFPDSQQNNPPASASRKWYIPPLASGETVHHFCLRATVTSSNDVNPHNNQVQSNIAYSSYTSGASGAMGFMAGNPTKAEIPVEFEVQTQLPRGWRVRILKHKPEIWLKPGEERPFQVAIDMPTGADKQLQPPFNGDITGKVFGSLTACFTGTLTKTRWDGKHLQGLLSANLDSIGALIGNFEGKINVLTGELRGRITGPFNYSGLREDDKRFSIGVEACLRPWRRIHVSQLVKGEPIGGITIQVQIPTPAGRCSQKLPPTGTHLISKRVPKQNVARFQIFKDDNGQFRFNLISQNNELITVSEAYATKASCLSGIESIMKDAPTAKVKDTTN